MKMLSLAQIMMQRLVKNDVMIKCVKEEPPKVRSSACTVRKEQFDMEFNEELD